MRNKIDWQIINAYIDGALSAQDAAEVAKAVAGDASLAKQVATLTSLKAAVAGALQERAPDVTLHDASSRRWLPWVASIAWALIAGAVVLALMLSTEWMRPATGLSTAEQAHQAWLQAGAGGSQKSEAGMLRTNLSLLELDAYVPDLSKVNLSFNGIRRISSHGGGLHIGYVGPSGCMVSLVVLKLQAGLPDSLQRFERGDHVAYGWSVGQASFYLLANRMDPLRFTEIAKVVHRLTRIRVPLDPQSVLALNQARQSAGPCAA